MTQIAEPIMDILSRAAVERNTLKLPQLNRNEYVATNKILVALGGKWDRKIGGHVFPEDISQEIEEIVLTGEYLDKKKEFGFFETPTWLVERMVDVAAIQPSMLILEPSAGRGAIADVVSDIVGNESVHCIDILPENCEHLEQKGYDCLCADFLKIEAEPKYDRILMNPPFALQADIAHVSHAVGFLKPEGKLIAIMSAGLCSRNNRKAEEFRQQFSNSNIEVLHDSAFKSSGTMVQTVMFMWDNKL